MNEDAQSFVAVSLRSLNAPSPLEEKATKDTFENPKNHDVDRGYAWVVLAAVFVSFVLNAVTTSTGTLLYQAYLLKFELTATSAGLVMSVMLSVRMLSSPFVGMLFQKFTFRTVAMAGSIIYSFGLLFIGFSTGLGTLHSANLLLALGGNIVIMSSFIVIPFYFVKKRGMAMAFGLCGHNIGAMVFPPLVTRNLTLYGYTTTLIFMACVAMQMLVSTALYRPQKAADVPEPPPKVSQSKWQTFKEKSGLSVLKSPLIFHLIVVTASVQCLFNLGMIYTSGLAIERANMSSYEIATALSIAGFSEFFKLGIGVLFDRPMLRPHRMYLYCLGSTLVGILGIILAFTFNMLTFTIIFTMYTMLLTSMHCQNLTILGDVIPLNELPQALTFNRSMSGVLLLVLPPIVGRIKDLWNSFQLGFIVVAVTHITIVVSYTVVYYCKPKNALKDLNLNEPSVVVDELAEEASPKPV